MGKLTASRSALTAIRDFLSPVAKAELTAPSALIDTIQQASPKLGSLPRTPDTLAQNIATKTGLSPKRVATVLPKSAGQLTPQQAMAGLSAEPRYFERAKSTPPVSQHTAGLIEDLRTNPDDLPTELQQELFAGLRQVAADNGVRAPTRFTRANLETLNDRLMNHDNPAIFDGIADFWWGPFEGRVVDFLHGGLAEGLPKFAALQRQKYPGRKSGEYFETVLRGPDGKAWPTVDGDHFDNAVQYGHLRGTVLPNRGVLLEELQSDPLKVKELASRPELHNIYGQLAKGALERAAQSGASKLVIPDYRRIAEVRPGENLDFFKKVYSDGLEQQFYAPLRDAGVSFSNDNGFNTLELSEAVMQILRDNPKLLGFKNGGLVQASRPSHAELYARRGQGDQSVALAGNSKNAGKDGAG